jgi:acetyl esterase/lipase
MRSRLLQVLLPLLLLPCLTGPSPPAAVAEPASLRRIEDIVYGRKDGLALTLDLFVPERPNGAGLLFLVNGGWLSSKATPLMVTIRPDDYAPFLARGYTVFAVVTSSQPRYKVADEIDDSIRAVRFIRTHAAEHGVDPDRLGIVGASSGGHLALSVAARGAAGVPDAADPVERASAAVEAVACFFPPTDFANYGGPGIDGLGAGPLKALEVAFGSRGLSPEHRALLAAELSPITHVSDRLPPTLIIHGDRDEVVPLEQSESFAARAAAAGAAPVEIIVRPGQGHGWGDFWRSTEDVEAFADWFDRHLRPR